MKKLVLILFVLLSTLSVSGQQIFNFYERVDSIGAIKYYGESSIDTISNYFDLPSSFWSGENPNIYLFTGIAEENIYPGDYVYRVGTTMQILHSYDLWRYTSIDNVLYRVVYSKGECNSKFFPIPVGNSNQYLNGAGNPATFPTNLSQFTNGPGYITTESDGSTTNEIELPTQAGQSNKYLKTNGTTVSWESIATTSISSPSIGNSITSGTAFQPRSGGPCAILINSTLSNLIAVAGTVLVQTCPTQNGTYITVSQDALLLSALLLTVDKSSGTIFVPTGHWVKVTYAGSPAPTGVYTRWDL